MVCIIVHTLKANTNISKRMRKRYCVLISLRNVYPELAKHSLSWEKSKGENERRKRNEGVYGLIGWQWWEFSATLNKFLIKQSIHIIFSCWNGVFFVDRLRPLRPFIQPLNTRLTRYLKSHLVQAMFLFLSADQIKTSQLHW